MTREALTNRISTFTDVVLADWRWSQDDLTVSVLGMLLYGYAQALAEEDGLDDADVDAAVLHCITKHVGAAAKWSGGLIEAAKASASDKMHHPGQNELIKVGRTYVKATDEEGIIENAFANFANERDRAGLPELTVTVFLNPLSMLLFAREKQKGSPLTEEEVLEVRDNAACTSMPLSKAELFYASLDAQMSIPRLNPDRLWEEWKAVRLEITDK